MTRPVSDKKVDSAKLYQKYRKFYENERKENDRLKKMAASQANDLKKLKQHNTTLLEQVKRIRQTQSSATLEDKL